MGAASAVQRGAFVKDGDSITLPHETTTGPNGEVTVDGGPSLDGGSCNDAGSTDTLYCPPVVVFSTTTQGAREFHKRVDDVRYLSVQPSEAAGLTWSAYLGSSSNPAGTRRNQVHQQGFNLNSSLTDGTLSETTESHYQPSIGQIQWEKYLQYVAPNGFSIRPYGVVIDKTTGIVTGFARMASVTVSNQDDAQKIYWNATASRMGLSSGVYLQSEGNDQYLLGQANAAGNGYVELVRVNASNQAVLGSGGAVSATGSRLLVNTTTDDAATALQVSGSVKATGDVSANTSTGTLLGAGATVTTSGTFNTQHSNLAVIGSASGFTAYPGIWFGSSAPTISNYNLLKDQSGNGLYLMDPSSLNLRINNAAVGAITSTGLSITGTITATGGVVIGTGGTLISKSLATTSTINFGSIGPVVCEDSSGITLTGIEAGSPCAIGVPVAAVTTGSSFTCRSSATDTAIITHCCLNGTLGVCNPASGAFQIRVTNP